MDFLNRILIYIYIIYIYIFGKASVLFNIIMKNNLQSHSSNIKGCDIFICD